MTTQSEEVVEKVDERVVVEPQETEEEEEGETENTPETNPDTPTPTPAPTQAPAPQNQDHPCVRQRGGTMLCITSICTGCGWCNGAVVPMDMPRNEVLALPGKHFCVKCGAKLDPASSCTILSQSLEYADNSGRWKYVTGVDIHEVRQYHKINNYRHVFDVIGQIGTGLKTTTRHTTEFKRGLARKLRDVLLYIDTQARRKHRAIRLVHEPDQFEPLPQYSLAAQPEIRQAQPQAQPPKPKSKPKESLAIKKESVVLKAVGLITKQLGGKAVLKELIPSMKLIQDNGGLAVFVEAMEYL